MRSIAISQKNQIRLTNHFGMLFYFKFDVKLGFVSVSVSVSVSVLL